MPREVDRSLSSLSACLLPRAVFGTVFGTVCIVLERFPPARADGGSQWRRFAVCGCVVVANRLLAPAPQHVLHA